MKVVCNSIWKFWLSDIDARIYSILRITFAFAAILNWYDLWCLRYDLFSNIGLVTQDSQFYGEIRNGLFAFGDSISAVDFYFAISGVAIVLLLLGLFTRVSAITVFVWSVSYSYRIAPANEGLDIVYRSMSFLMMFAPLARVWSIDALLRRRVLSRVVNARAPIYSLRLMQWQFLLIYFVNVIPKVQNASWQSGYFLNNFMLSMYARFPSAVISDYTSLVAFLGQGALVAEILLPFLLWWRKSRFLGFALGIFLHGGIAISSHLYIFSAVMLSLYPMFLRSEDIEWLVACFRNRFEVV